MLGHFQTLLKGAIARPDQRIAGLPLLTVAETQHLLVEWNSDDRERLEIGDWRLSDAESPISNLQSLISIEGSCAHTLFEVQASDFFVEVFRQRVDPLLVVLAVRE